MPPRPMQRCIVSHFPCDCFPCRGFKSGGTVAGIRSTGDSPTYLGRCWRKVPPNRFSLRLRHSRLSGPKSPHRPGLRERRGAVAPSDGRRESRGFLPDWQSEHGAFERNRLRTFPPSRPGHPCAPGPNAIGRGYISRPAPGRLSCRSRRTATIPPNDDLTSSWLCPCTRSAWACTRWRPALLLALVHSMTPRVITKIPMFKLVNKSTTPTSTINIFQFRHSNQSLSLYRVTHGDTKEFPEYPGFRPEGHCIPDTIRGKRCDCFALAPTTPACPA